MEHLGKRMNTMTTATTRPSTARSPDTKRRRERTWLLTLPALALVIPVFLIPTVLVLSTAFTEAPAGLSHIRDVFTSSLALGVLGRSLSVSLIVTVISLVLALPYAMFVAKAGARLRNLFLGAVLCTLFFSVIVRAYAWLALLGKGGPIPEALHAIGLMGADGSLAHTRTATIIAMTQYGVPYMLLALYDNIRRLDPALERAAAICGANRVTRFLRVSLPLMLPGIASGSIIVFVTTLGYYIIPAVVGSPQDMMVGQLISVQINTATNWGFGAAIGAVLAVVALACFVLFRLVGRLERRYR